MAVLTRFAWINALLLVAIALGTAVAVAAPASAASTEDKTEETASEATELAPIDDPSQVPATPPSDDAGIAEAEGIVKALGGCEVIGKAIDEYMWILDQAYHAKDWDGYVKAFDMLGALRWAGQVFCGFR
jgi:hypothetical protein